MPATPDETRSGDEGVQTYFEIDRIRNLEAVLDRQVRNFQDTRRLVRDLQFIPVDPVASYSAVSYKSIDGGKLGIYFDPFEMDFVKIADSFGNETMAFLVPTNEYLSMDDFAFLDEFREVQHFLGLLGVVGLHEACDLIQTTQHAMLFAEMACIFEQVARDTHDPILIMKDGLLRNPLLKREFKPVIYDVLRARRHKKVVGVAKRTKVLNLIGAALWAEGIVPPDRAGFIEIPLEIEREVYSWPQSHPEYPYGKLYVAKLSPQADLLVTVEIPHDRVHDRPVYTPGEIEEIFGHLLKDSMYSFPTLGYPQTIMRAHEKAVSAGFTASIIRDFIMDEILRRAGNAPLQNQFREAWLLKQFIKNPDLGGT